MKKVNYLIIFILMFGLSFSNVKAVTLQYGYTVDILHVRETASSSSTILKKIYKGYNVAILNIVSSGSGCTSNWYYVEYEKNKFGYVCSGGTDGTYVKKYEINAEEMPKTEYEKELALAGFPKSYWSYLTKLHQAHPTWEFSAIRTGLNWNTAVNAESVIPKSLINSWNQGYRSVESIAYNYETDIFTPFESTYWFAANSQTVGYFMDPRNFLNEDHLFMFEDLTFIPSFQTEEVVLKVFGNSYLKNYSGVFMGAAGKYNISPVHLASRVRQEVGLDVITTTSGTAFNYNGRVYQNLYNFYNIGAVPGGVENNAALNGLIYANGGEDCEGCTKKKTYGRPWNTREKAIDNGALWIAEDYINVGQQTPYFQKWNVNPNSDSTIYNHQYMTNVMAPRSESVSSFNAYNEMGLLNEALMFTIPVYENMPATTSLPNPGNPNNYLKSLTVNGKAIPNFSNDVSEYKVYVPEEVNNVTLGATSVTTYSTTTGLGKIPILNKENVLNVVVTAENGAQKTFKITVIKSKDSAVSVDDIANNIGVKNDGKYFSGINIGTNINSLIDNIKKISSAATVTITDSNGNVKVNAVFATSDRVIISNGAETKTFTIVIYGDNNGDGDITILDLLRTQKYLLNSLSVNEVYVKAMDTNKDSTVTIMDLLKVQKHIIGSNKIEQ